MRDIVSTGQRHDEVVYREDAALLITSSAAFPCSNNCRYFENLERITNDQHRRISCRCEL
ncbi:unnamed protein product [Rhodiola kirilowii]